MPCPQNYRHLTVNTVGATIGRLMNAECRVQNAEWRVRLRKGRKDTPPKLQMQFRRDMACRVRKTTATSRHQKIFRSQRFHRLCGFFCQLLLSEVSEADNRNEVTRYSAFRIKSPLIYTRESDRFCRFCAKKRRFSQNKFFFFKSLDKCGFFL